MSSYLVSILLLVGSLNYRLCWVITDIDLEQLYEGEKLDNEKSVGTSDFSSLDKDIDDIDYIINNENVAPEDLLRLKFNLIYPGE